MHETSDDLDWLQDLLDTSYALGGTHMHRVVGDEHRMSARQLVDELTGMRLLTVATVTADGRPITGPVDSFFYRGRFHFGSAPDSVRMSHLRARPAASATHLPGEHLSVSVHGTATLFDPNDPEHVEFRAVLVGNYGEQWAEQMLGDGAVYARLEPRRMVTFSMPEA